MRLPIASGAPIKIACICAALLHSPLLSAQPQAPTTIAYQIDNTQVVARHSKLLRNDYDLYVKLPNSYAKQSSCPYPIFFLHVARYSFALASRLTRQLSNAGKIKGLIIGISYSKGGDPDLSRTRDYTPTHSPHESIGRSAAVRQASGEAPAYLRFVLNEVFPFVAQTYRADMSRKTYASHSFGGLFGAYVALTAPRARGQR